jgi:ATP/ADP translocase
MQNVKALSSRLFNVHDSERKTVSLLFMHHFLQGFGLALIFVVANSLFLSEYSVKELPKVYIVSGVLVLIAGRIYAWYEHHIPIKKLLTFVVICSFTLIILLWGLGQAFSPATFAFLLLSVYQILYLLYNLEFWGLSALVFDVRQSKRLFSLISAGDMPAKMLGYLLVSLVAPFLALNHLILLSGIAVLASLYFLRLLLKERELHEKNDKDLHHRYQSSNKNKAMHLLQRFFKNRFISIAAVLSLIAVITLASINFAFLSEVKYKFKTDKELAAFFGLFFAAGQFFTIFMKAFLSGRVIQWIGVKKALLALPVNIILILLIGFFIQGVDGHYKHLLYIYGFLMLVTEVFNYSMQQPLFLSLFQPLNAHLRLHGHTVIKGFVDGVARILAGLGILLLLNLGTSNQLMSFGLVILALGGIWLFWVLVTEKSYIQMLQDAIRIRRISGTDWHLQDDRLQGKILEKIRSGRPWEVIYHLEILKNNHPDIFEAEGIQAANHEHLEVRNWAIQNLADETIQKNMDYFRKEALESIGSDKIQYGLIERVAANDPGAYNWSEDLLKSHDEQLIEALIKGLLKGQSIEGMVMAGNRLIELKNSSKKEDKMQTCTIIRDLKLQNFHQILRQYLSEKDAPLSRKVIEVAAALQLTPLLPDIVQLLEKYLKKSWFLQASAAFGPELLDHLEPLLETYDENKEALESLIFICRHIPGKRSQEFLMNDSFFKQADIRQKVLSVLSETEESPLSELLKAKTEKWLEDEISFLEFLLLSGRSESASKSWNHMIQVEINNLKQRIFNYLHLLYPNADLPVKRDAYFSHFANKRANTLENLDSILNRKHKARLMPLLEDRPHPSNKGEEITIDQIIPKGVPHLSAWSLAYCIHSARTQKGEVFQTLPDPILNSRWKIIREQVQSLNAKNDLMDKQSADREELMELEKVSILKNTSLFRETPENLLVDLAGLVHTLRLEKGETLFHEGDPGDAMFIIHTGKIEISNDQSVLASFGELDFFGELSLLDDEARSATAKAIEHTLLLSISQEDFYELITFRPEVAKSVLRVLSQRLRKQNKS